jgi:hypothetical protein
MIWDGTLYKPEVAWRTVIREAVLVQAETISTPAIYQATVEPTDNIDPGANTAAKAVNYNILDYLGHIYRITQINVGGNSKRVLVSDDFRWKQSPINGKQAIVYKSVGGGFAPWLAATYGTHLSSTAANTAAGIDNAILWKTSDKIEFTNTSTPTISNYQQNYSIPYGQLPKFTLVTYDSEGVEWERQEVPVRNYVEGLLDSVVWDLSDLYSGYIIISR